MSKISELSNGGALLATDDLIVVRSGGNVRAQLSAISGQSVSATTLAASGASTLTGAVGINITPTSYKLTVNSGATTETTAAAIGYNGDNGTNLYINTDHGNNLVSLYASGSASKEMRFLSGSLEVMRLGTTGNVGIGSTTVNRKLEVAGNNNAGAKANYIRITDTDTTATANNQAGGIEFFTNDVTPGIAASMEVLYAGSGGGGEITFNTNASSSGTLTEALRINELGNVGIGSASPSSTFRTSIYGDGSSVIGGIEFRNASSGGSTFTIGHASATSPSATLNVVDSGNLIFKTSNTERMRISSAGSVGIGVSNPSDYYANNLVVGAASEGGITIASSATTYNNYLAFADSSSGVARYAGLISYDHNIDVMHFRTNSLERMRIDSGGDVFIASAGVNPSASQTGFAYRGGAGGYGFIATSVAGTAALTHHAFYNPNGVCGQIYTTGSSTVYAQTSDYRLKENVVGITGATQRLLQLKPSRFNFIADANTTVDGFLAHEIADVVPEAIVGTKDAVDADGNPDYQGIDQSKLVPLLVATIQELEARLTALENN